MRIPGSGRLRRVAQRVRNHLAPGGIILLYHHIEEVGSDPWSLCVNPRHFAEHLEVLRKFGSVMRLQQLNQILQDGKHPHKYIVVTFDDGYADNLYNAKPLLERYEIPATMFLTTGYRLQKREFWSDELDRLLLQPGTLPEVLSLNINGTSYSWELGTAATYSEAEYRRYRYLDVLEKDNPSIRHSLYYTLYQQLYALPSEKRGQVIDQILVWAGAEPVVRPTHRLLTQLEVPALEKGGLIEIGAHTVTHPFLSTLPADAQRLEIQSNKAQIEETLGHPVVSFAYPHGNYSEETITLVQEAGFTCACSTVAKTVRRRSDRFKLPRFNVKDWDGQEFAKRLSGWFAG